jgi:glutathione S-transferase
MNAAQEPIKLFQFPRRFGIPNLSPFCCKLEPWLRIAGVPYEVVETRDPRKGPRGKLPFIEDGGRRIADTSIIVEHLKKTRGVDPDARLDASQRAIALLVQRTLEEHYAFVVAYTHLVRDEGVRHTRIRFDAVPAFVRPLVARTVRGKIKAALWQQGIMRYSHNEIVDASLRDWQADAIVFGTLATTILTPIESEIRDALASQPKLVAYAERIRSRFFADLSAERTSA